MVLLKKITIPFFMLTLAALVLSAVWDALTPHIPQTLATEGNVPTLLDTSAYTLPPIYIEQQTHIPYRRTLSSVLLKEGFSPQDVYLAARTLNKLYRLNRLPAGAEFLFSYKEPQGKERPTLSGLDIFTEDDRRITISRDASGSYKAKTDERVTERQLKVAQGSIQSSLYLAAQKAGLPDQLIVPFIELFSWDMDFTRDIRQGDSFKVVFEEIQDERGEFIRYGDILAGEMTLKRLENPVSAFRAENGKYYDAKGHAKRKALLRTPLKFTRISSHFNPNRKHPVLGYTRAHRGTDFAARTGTPIRAAGDGRVEFVGWKGGYGRYIKIRHSKEFSTAYAHLSRYKSSVKTGRYVKQGDVIGYVGMSGTATGPHLHYEVLRHGRQVNALKVRLPQGAPLPENLQASFKERTILASKLWQSQNQLASRKSAAEQ